LVETDRFWKKTNRAWLNALWPLPNVHLGVSIEDRATADERIPLLLQCPAAVRWVSYEPALGPVDFGPWLRFQETRCEGRKSRIHCNHWYDGGRCCSCGDPAMLDWIVVGGESGPGRRPFEIDWLRSAADQCQAAGVPVFVKQDSGPKPGMQGRIPDELWIKEMP
jgi:protein gp37